MKVKVGGPLAHAWSDGTVESWTGAVLDVDDADAERAGYFHELTAAGMAEILEPPAPAPKVEPSVTAKEARKATAAAVPAEPAGPTT